MSPNNQRFSPLYCIKVQTRVLKQLFRIFLYTLSYFFVCVAICNLCLQLLLLLYFCLLVKSLPFATIIVVQCHCLCDLSLSCWPHKNWFLPVTDHVMAAHTVTQFQGSFSKEKLLIGAARSSILVFFLSISVWIQPWVNVMSYQLLLGCGGQTADCHQIANQLIQISLHWAKSLLIPLKIQSLFPHRSTCSSLCVCVLACGHKGGRER